ncbi:MAG: flippase [Gemmatimonadales bacterium]
MTAPGPGVTDHSERLVRRNFLALGAGEAAARLIAFGATVYVARTLGAGPYGVVGFALAILLYLNYLADCGIETLGVREIAEDHERVHTMAPAVLTARIVAAAAIIVVVIPVALFLLPQPDGGVLAVYVLTLLALGGNTKWIHLGLERAGRVALARVLGESSMAVLVVLLVHSAADLGRVPLAQFSGDILAALLLAFFLRRQGVSLRLRLDLRGALPVLRRSFPLAAHALLGLMIYNSDLIFLRGFRGAAETGYYVAAYTLVSFLLNLGIAYSQSLLPTLHRLAPQPERQRALYQTSMAQVFTAAFPVAVGGSLLSGGIILLVFGPAFAASAVALQILLWSIPVAFYRNVPQMALISAGRQHTVLGITFVSALLNLGLNLAVIPRWGMAGAAWATLGTEIIRSSLALRYAARAGFPLPALSRLWRPLVAGLVMGGVVFYAGRAGVLPGIGAGIAAYFVVLWLVGGIRVVAGELPSLTV